MSAAPATSRALAVVVPVFNEAGLVAELLRRLVACPVPAGLDGRRVFVVDDGSTDGTAQAVEAFIGRTHWAGSVRLLRHDRNRGKGAAVRTGVEAALAEGAGVLLIQDGDLEYDPRDHAALLAPIIDGRADAVIGTRFLGQTHRVLYFWHALANRALTLVCNAATNLNLSDIECCLKAFTAESIAGVRLRENRFGIEPELVAKLARARLGTGAGGTERRRARVYEVAVSYAGRTYAEGKKIRARDGVAALWCIFKYGVLRLK